MCGYIIFIPAGVIASFEAMFGEVVSVGNTDVEYNTEYSILEFKIPIPSVIANTVTWYIAFPSTKTLADVCRSIVLLL